MTLDEFISCGKLAHGHACPPLVLGIRAGFAAMNRLGVGRALDRELFAFVEPWEFTISDREEGAR